MRKFRFSSLALSTYVGMLLLFFSVSTAHATVGLVIDGIILNSDGTTYSDTAHPLFLFFVGQGTNRSTFNLQSGTESGRPEYFTSSPCSGTCSPIAIPTDKYWMSTEARATRAPVYYTGTNTSEIEPGMEGPVEVDLSDQLSTKTITVQLLKPHKYISGTLLDDRGDPAPDQILWVSRVDSSGLQGAGIARSVKTDADGRYTLAVASTGGSYGIYIMSDDPEKYLSSFAPQKIVTFASDTSDEMEDPQLTIQRVGTSIIKGKVVDKNGEAVSNARVYVAGVIGSGSDLAIGSGKSSSVSADSTFSLKVASGTYLFSVTRILISGNKWFYVEYPQLTVGVVDDQTVDLGDVSPTKAFQQDEKIPEAPDILSFGQSLSMRKQKGKTRVAQFNEFFQNSTLYDARASTNVTWSKSGVSITAAARQSSAVRTTSVSTPLASVGTVVSKIFPPHKARITTILITDVAKTSGASSIQYAVSTDGKRWFPVPVGQRTTFATPLVATSGLRWRATLRKSAKNDTVTLSGVHIEYTYQPTGKAPSISKVRVQRSGNQSTITVRGRNLDKHVMLYIGGRSVTKAKSNNGTLSVTVNLSDYPKSSYVITVVNQDLRAATSSKKILYQSS